MEGRNKAHRRIFFWWNSLDDKWESSGQGPHMAKTIISNQLFHSLCTSPDQSCLFFSFPVVAACFPSSGEENSCWEQKPLCSLTLLTQAEGPFMDVQRHSHSPLQSPWLSDWGATSIQWPALLPALLPLARIPISKESYQSLVESLTQQASDLQLVQLNWGKRFNTRHCSWPVLWPLHTAKASAWSRESKGRKGKQQCHFLPSQWKACRERAWSNMPAVVTLDVLHSRFFLGKEGDCLAHTSHSVCDSVETHLQLLHDSRIPSHLQISGLFTSS